MRDETVDGTQAFIERVLLFFLPHCSDKSTMLALKEMASNPKAWRYAHALFRKIREKTLQADEANDRLLQHQFGFEEICAKTLYNLSEHNDPECVEFPERFDDDSAFWFLPLAIGFARALSTTDFLSSVFGFDETP